MKEIVQLLSLRRQVALRVTTAYSTVSQGAVVVTGIPLKDLQAWERCELIDEGRAGEATLAQIKRNAIQRLLRKWEDRWGEDVSGRQTYSLSKQHREMDRD